MVVTVHRERPLIHRIEAPTGKDDLVALVGRVPVEVMTDDARTRLRGGTADFNAGPVERLRHRWRLESDLGTAGHEDLVIVVESSQP